MSDVGVFVHIVVWNELGPAFNTTVASIFEALRELPRSCVEVTDNGSHLKIKERLSEIKQSFPAIVLHHNQDNLGFCGAHNQGVTRFLQSDLPYLLVLNPDTRLTASSILELIEALRSTPGCDIATPKILRCKDLLESEVPPTIDAAGMEFTPAFRHFDRESGAIDHGQRNSREVVFGGTGACLLASRRAIDQLLLPRFPPSDRALVKIYPQLAKDLEKRCQIFDEAFFAYREDADLALRAATLGIGCVYEPAAIVYHVRRVTPERRSALPPDLNRLSVRNRFLLQLNHWNWRWPIRIWIEGIFFRNFLVVLGVLIKERSSLSALWDVVRLAPRALRQRSYLRGLRPRAGQHTHGKKP